MKKRLFSFLLAVLMLCSLVPAARAADVGPDTALHSREEIANYMAQFDYQTDEDDTFATAPDCNNPPYRAGEISAKTRADALAIVNTIRYIAGLPEVTSDAEYEAYAQAAALVNAVNDDLSHDPDQPEQMSDELYRQAYYGASHSNLSYGRQNLYQSVVFGWMADSSSQSNLDTVGHRRWVLNPSMAKTGFGIVPLNGSFGYTRTVSAMYATDFGRTNAPETVVVWPARYTPYQFFSPYVPWSVSVDAQLNPEAISVTLQRQGDGRTWHFSSAAADGHFSVSTNAGYGGMPCIIFMPNEGMGQMDDGCCVPGDSYTVTVTGALPQTIRYTVEFFDPDDYKDTPEYPPHEHQISVCDAKDATCEQDGYTGDKVCSICGEVLEKGSDIPALGHQLERRSRVDPTCTEPGYSGDTYCSRCNKLLEHGSAMLALGHDWNEGFLAVEPTLTQDGVWRYTCNRCHDIHDEPIPKLNCDHDYQDTVIAPTCTEGGYTRHICRFCGAEYRDSFTAPSHSPVRQMAKNAHCEQEGYTGDLVCSQCGLLLEAGEVISALGHDWGAWTVTTPATVQAEGEETRTCARCGEHETRAVARLKPANPFKDVPDGKYYTDAVLWAVNQKPQITNGTGANTFSPEETCTRGQVVTFLWRAMRCPEPKTTHNPFSDVKTSDYCYKAVLWAVENGITKGTGRSTFSPGSPCTRAHVVTFLWRAHGEPAAGAANPFRDVPDGQYFTVAVLWAVNHKPQITNGTGANTFSPDSPCTRGQIVTFLYRDLA